MADFKKPKPGGGGGSNSPVELLVFGMIAVFLVVGFFRLFAVNFDLVSILLGVREYFIPWSQNNLWWVEILSLIFSALFLWGTVYIIRKTSYLELKREQFLESLGKDFVSRRRSLAGWKQIQQRMRSADQNNWKLAVLEADHILNEILKMSGYLGTMDEKLPKLETEQLANIEDVKRAHLFRDKIAKDPAGDIKQEEAQEAISVYERAFRELNLIRED